MLCRRRPVTAVAALRKISPVSNGGRTGLVEVGQSPKPQTASRQTALRKQQPSFSSSFNHYTVVAHWPFIRHSYATHADAGRPAGLTTTLFLTTVVPSSSAATCPSVQVRLSGVARM